MSLLLALLRAKVDMERVGREAEMGAAGGTFFSGDSETECMVEAEGCLLWWDEAALCSDVLRLLRNCRLMSPTVLEMLCRLRFCGVVGTLAGGSYWLVTGGVMLDGGAVGSCSAMGDAGGR